MGGGGSRGIAHIGVLQVLVREGVPIDRIVGTSMGAIVGALFGLGLSLSDMIDHLAHWQANPLLSFNLFSARARQRAIEDHLAVYLEGRTFAELTIPMVVMAVDIVSGREVALDKGPLLPAVMASSALPVVFPPVEIDDMRLVDGGIVDSLCTPIARSYGVDRVIAVDIYPQLEADDRTPPLTSLMGFDLPLGGIEPNMVSALWRSYRIMAWHLHASRLAAHPPDVLLRPAVSEVASLDFKDIEGPLEAGIAEAEAHLPQIKALIGDDYFG
jgi:NTE family protein